MNSNGTIDAIIWTNLVASHGRKNFGQHFHDELINDEMFHAPGTWHWPERIQMEEYPVQFTDENPTEAPEEEAEGTDELTVGEGEDDNTDPETDSEETETGEETGEDDETEDDEANEPEED